MIVALKKLCFSNEYCFFDVELISQEKNILRLKIKAIVPKTKNIIFINELLNEGKLGMRVGRQSKENTKVMICGNLDFNVTIANYFLTLEWEEGNSKTAGSFVQEKAFVER